jgi:hypothetical protein
VPELAGTVHDGRMYSIYGARETVGYIVYGQGNSAGGEHLLAVGGVDVALHPRVPLVLAEVGRRVCALSLEQHGGAHTRGAAASNSNKYTGWVEEFHELPNCHILRRQLAT